MGLLCVFSHHFNEVLEQIAYFYKSGEDIKQHLDGPVCHETFARLN